MKDFLKQFAQRDTVPKMPVPQQRREAPFIISGNVRPRMNEAFNTLRTNFHLITTGKPVKKVIVTSAIPGEGKTTVAVNLAISLSRLGNKVLIADMDLRYPSVHQIIGLHNPPEKGVSTVLSGGTLSDAIIYQKSIGISILPAGPALQKPNEMLQSVSMKKLMKEMEALYDYIIIDTPPLTSVSDALALLPVTDGVIFVLRQRFTPFDAAEKARKALEQVNANVLGCVFNAYDVKFASSFYSDSYRDIR